MEFHLEQYDSISSTNDRVKEALRLGAPEGLVVRSRVQTNGYGRQGRTWVSPEGSLYQSLLLRPAVALEQLPTLGLVVACAFRQTLSSFVLNSPDLFQVKWPNDVLTNDGKLVGISLESCDGGVCVGTGANIWRPSVPPEIAGKNRVAYLGDYLDLPQAHENLIEEVAQVFLGTFDSYYSRWIQEGFDAFQEEYLAHHALNNKQVIIATPAGKELGEGRVVGIDAAGMLIVEEGDELLRYTSGEVHLIA